MNIMKNNFIRQNFTLFLLLIAPAVFAQENDSTTISSPSTDKTEFPRDKKVHKPVKSTFEGSELINNQTVECLRKKSLDFIISHRFGVIDNSDDLFGIFAPSNIRFGLSYGVTNNLTVGAGVTKNKMLYDLNWKYAILKQTRDGSMPISVTYYGTIDRSSLPNSSFNIPNPDMRDSIIYEPKDRFTYFNELMVARKFNNHISIQIGASYSHVNLVDSGMVHDVIGLSFIGRYKFSPQSSVIVEFDDPITVHDINKNMPNLGIGYEVETSGHTFQIFICTADGIRPAQIMVFNQNDFSKKDILIGFNIMRLWNF
jgi:hypothetical protein